MNKAKAFHTGAFLERMRLKESYYLLRIGRTGLPPVPLLGLGTGPL